MISTNRYLWKIRGSTTSPMSVAFLIDSDSPERWIVECCEQLASIEGLAVGVVKLQFGEQGRRPSQFSNWLGGAAFSVARESSSELTRQASVADYAGRALAGESLAEITARRHDVLIWLGTNSVDPATRHAARLGAWVLQLDGHTLGSGDKALFQNLCNDKPFIELSLARVVDEIGGLNTILSWNVAHLSGIRWRRNSVALQGVSTAICLGLLLCDAESGAPATAANEASQPEGRDRRVQDTALKAQRGTGLPHYGSREFEFGCIRLLGRKVLSKVKRQSPADDSALQEWSIWTRPPADRFSTSLRQGPWQPWNGFDGHGAADPFFLEFMGRTALLYEDILPGSRLGRIAGAEIDSAGQCGDPFVVLDKPYHLSFPHMFVHQGECYMIPESAANGTVDLYRATDFPREWQHDATLVKDARFVDTTPLCLDGVWYFFTTINSPGTDLISLLFVAEDLRAPWKLHPASPIETDIRSSRAAGAIIQEGGRWLRPVQNCWPNYGTGLHFFEILELSPTLYRQKLAAEYAANDIPGLVRLHSAARCRQLDAIDGRRAL